MRILFIPLKTSNLKSNEHIPNRIRILSNKNKIIGVEHTVSFTKGVESFAGLLKLSHYAFRVLFFGLKHRREFDLIYCWEPFYALIGLCISILTGKPCLRDNAIVTRYHHQQLGTFRSGLTTIIALIAERTVFRLIDMMIVLSEADRRAYVEQGFAPDKVEVIPLPVDFSLVDKVAADKEALRKRLALDKNKKILIFTGRRQYLPNRRAAWWINEELAPAISRKFDDAQILMTATGDIPQPAHPIITFTGFVPDIFEYIHATDIAIAPLEILSGVLVKVLDSMSCGKPTVVMTQASKGIPELIDGFNCMIARDKDDFIAKTLYLLDHPDEAQHIGIRARETIEKHYAVDTWEERLNEVLKKCIG